MKNNNGFGIVLSFGRYGGFYATRKRIVLGWFAITFTHYDADFLFMATTAYVITTQCGFQVVNVLGDEPYLKGHGVVYYPEKVTHGDNDDPR